MYLNVLVDKFFTRKYDSYKYENHNSWVIALQDCFMKQFLCDHPSFDRYREEQVIFKHHSQQKVRVPIWGFVRQIMLTARGSSATITNSTPLVC